VRELSAAGAFCRVKNQSIGGIMKTWILRAIVLAGLGFCSPVRSQWVQTNGTEGGDINSFAVCGANLFAGTYDNGVFLSTNNGDSWTGAGLTNNHIRTLAVIGPDLFAAGTGAFLSTNNGGSWTAIDTGLPTAAVWSLAVRDTYLFAATGSFENGPGGAFVSTNNGTSWTSIGFTNTTVLCFAISGRNLFAGTWGDVFLSTDNGGNWTAVNTGLPLYVSTFAVSPAGGGPGTNLFAGAWEGVFLSTNNGSSWTTVNSGLTNTNVRAFAVSPASGGAGSTNLFVGTDSGGVFLSSNNGTSWTAVNDGLTNTHVSALAVFGANLFAGTIDGVWRRPLSQLVSVPLASNELPKEFDLGANYPNPFNPSTTVSYQLPVNSFVTLKIFDVLGCEVATLVNEERSAGSYGAQWNAEGFSSGVYLMRMQANNFFATKKIVLMK
jgi:hypothetical protein